MENIQSITIKFTNGDSLWIDCRNEQVRVINFRECEDCKQRHNSEEDDYLKESIISER